MSLFPQGLSGQDFQNDDSVKTTKKTKNVQKEENFDDVILQTGGVKLSPLQKKLLESQKKSNNVGSEKKIELKSNKKEEVKSDNVKTEEKPLIKTPVKNTAVKSGSKKKEVEYKPVIDSEFPTSVKIAGLTSEDNNLYGANELHSDLEGNQENSYDEKYANLSALEKQELEEISEEEYLKDYPTSTNLYGGVSLEELLQLAIDKEASDIHIASGGKVGLRINGKIFFIEGFDELSSLQARAIIFGIVKNPLDRKKLFENKELDTAYEYKGNASFRVNIFFKRGKIAAVLRLVASKALSVEELGLPVKVKSLLEKKQGLILVTGPTGSGKSTSMQSMLDYINNTRVEHIITIEDPIEFIFRNKKSIFSQRELGNDTKSFANALKAAMREDPDIIMIGEMRDPETMQTAMLMAETGHLVISTLHTSSAAQTVSRIVSSFKSEEQDSIRSRLAESLIGILSQRLVPRIDKLGRVGIFELMLVNSAIRNIIRLGDWKQMSNAMLTGRSEGMILMKDYGQSLVDKKVIEEKDYIGFFQEE